MQRPGEDVLSWMLKKIDSETNSFIPRLNELRLRVNNNELSMEKSLPVLSNMMMTLDFLHRDAGTLLSLCKSEDRCQTGQDISKQSSDNPLDSRHQERSHAAFDPVKMKDESRIELESMINKMQYDLLKVNKIHSNFTERLNTLEQAQSSQNCMLQQVDKLVNTATTANASIQQRLETIEELEVSNLSHKVNHLEKEVLSSLQDRVEMLENCTCELRGDVFGEKGGLPIGNPCILNQLLDLQVEGKAKLEVIDDKVTRLEDDLVANSMDKSEETGESPVEFQVLLDVNGNWENDGDLLNQTPLVTFNHGDAFDKEGSRFIVPNAGLYKFDLWLKRIPRREEPVRLEVWRCSLFHRNDRLFFVKLKAHQTQTSYDISKEMHVGDVVTVKLFGDIEFIYCVFGCKLLHTLDLFGVADLTF